MEIVFISLIFYNSWLKDNLAVSFHIWYVIVVVYSLISTPCFGPRRK